MKVRWTMPAVRELEAISDYIAQDNPAAANSTVRRIREVIQRTARMPKAGRAGRVAGSREVVVPGTSYVVAYRVLENEKMIHVLAILHGAQEWPKSF